MVWKMGRGDPYALLRELAGEEIAGQEMERRPGGKPWFPALPEFHFNVSHSHGLALCAVSDVEVGCDIEWVRPRSAGLPLHVLDQRELRWFRSRGERWEDFYTLWTMKEAKVKCTGQGLRIPPREIAVPLISPGKTIWFRGYRFTALGGEDWRGAVCQEEPV